MKVKNASKLNAFISGAVKKGMTKAEIVKKLESKGWSKDFAKKYCDKYLK